MYARFTTVFLRDMTRLPELHPNVHAAFMKGLFVVQRSKTKFSLIGLDQSQKQNVKHIREDGGNRGLYSYQEDKELMEISRPEVLRVLREEISYNADDDKVKEYSEAAQYNKGSLEI